MRRFLESPREFRIILKTIATMFVIAFIALRSSAQSVEEKKRIDVSAIAFWQSQIPSIASVLEKSGLKCSGHESKLEILDAFGLKNGDPSAALVRFCSDGAYTDEIIPMLMHDGRLEIARLRDLHGRDRVGGLAMGASVMHTVEVKLEAAKKAIYDLHFDLNNEGKLGGCGVRVYAWNGPAGTFDESRRTSKSETDRYCADLRKAYTPTSKN